MKRPVIICQNSKCGADIKDYKSNKRKFCSDYCKNSYGYQKRNEQNAGINAFKDKLKENEKILKFFKQRNVVEVPIKLMDELGFNNTYSELIGIREIITKQKEKVNVKLFKINKIYYYKLNDLLIIEYPKRPNYEYIQTKQLTINDDAR